MSLDWGLKSPKILSREIQTEYKQAEIQVVMTNMLSHKISQCASQQLMQC